MAMKSVLIVTAIVVCFLAAILARHNNRRPRIYGHAIPKKELDPAYSNTRRKIVLYHNFFRAKVEPPARDMLQMKWHSESAEDAQRWAEACHLLVHDNVTGRWVEDYGSCGQNIFVANVQVPWFFAVKTWYLEKDNFTYGGVNDIGVVGHYTQLVWYSSHKVGCGFHYCGHAKPRPYYNYVCNYCPIGNYPDRISKPYKKGKPCSGCEGACKYKKLCTNACPYGDLWMNCQELNATWHKWLCHGNSFDQCKATCLCGNHKIM